MRAGFPIASGWLCCVGVFALTLAPGTSSQAEAALFYWNDNGSYYQQPVVRPPRRQKPKLKQSREEARVEKETAKPQGPVIVAVSIGQQQMKVYDSNGLFAESPVSTGMKGHPTPTGIFSVIQKNKFHRSNIYSGAPMPYMQRITWSGVAMHAGVLPGYPASHGCIRLPMSFAMKMWNWTRMGARVVVTPGEISAPSRFAHALLPASKIPAPAIAAAPAEKPAGPKADRGSDLRTDLKASIGHGEVSRNSEAARERTQTADASAEVAAVKVTMTDETAPSQPKPADAESVARPAAADEAKPAEPVAAAIPDGDKPAEAAAASNADSVRTEAKPDQDRIAAPAVRQEPEQPKAAPAPTVVETPAPSQDTRKDQSRHAEPVYRPDLSPRGQIAVFISRKDSKIYVRQNFKPVFDAPVTIAPDERPLGTHIFTAEVDKTDSNAIRWSVVSVPASPRSSVRDDSANTPRRGKKKTVLPAPEPKPPVPANSAAEALDRITVPADIMPRIAEALATGGSVIVSDQGVNQGGETGEGTEFIVSLR